MKNQKGLTLIEVILYLALFSVLIGGAISGFYNLMAGDFDLSTEALLVDESEFFLGKMDWVLNLSSEIIEPNSGETSGRLVLKDGSGFNLSLALDENGDIFLKYQNEDPNYLNNSRVKLHNLAFVNQKIRSNPDVFLIKSSFEIDGQKFNFGKLIYGK